MNTRVGFACALLVFGCNGTEDASDPQESAETSEPAEASGESTAPEAAANPEEPPEEANADEAPDEAETEAAAGARVEVALRDRLDGVVSSYCLDIAGGNRNVDPANGLQAHTCYSYRGDLGADQAFDREGFEGNAFVMPEFEVCVTLSALEPGASVELAACDERPEQQLEFTDAGLIRPVSATNLCVTAADEARFGRSQQHQIRALSVEACSDELAPLQQWYARTAAEAQ